MIAVVAFIFPMIINAISENFPLILLNFVVVLLALVVVLVVPFAARDGSTRHIRIIMLIATGYSLTGLLPVLDRTIFTVLTPILMTPLTVLVFFQPSIRHANVRYEEFYTRYISPDGGRDYF
ncbi:MAG: hypothetical protein FWD93_03245 [Coriobacteriia bacterium]|nr:hypothetical protein [Coriobacteriia bacterium]